MRTEFLELEFSGAQAACIQNDTPELKKSHYTIKCLVLKGKVANVWGPTTPNDHHDQSFTNMSISSHQNMVVVL